MKKQNIGTIALILGGAGLAFYLYKKSKAGKDISKGVNVEPVALDESEEKETSEQTPGSEGLIDRNQAKRFVTEKIIPGAKNLLTKARQKFKARKKTKSRVIIQPTENITKEEFERPITRKSKRQLTRQRQQMVRTEKRDIRRSARLEKRSARKAKRQRNVSGFDNIPILV